ncbi:Inner membrane metabolite transport protein YdjE [Methylobacterium crusticola]|uniref:Inner membrane metabolite transport protein YdjE n=1 Tax=Methylobacterium crusticola TaxID=1697972 RepID=A0ABQ4QUJ5_9HYPH|nr:MFS transporter [Methylobacterium crusticola]GJD48351.1 Inner membrane metabolite transport protein YdjE [Methylobacterium crusticola]
MAETITATLEAGRAQGVPERVPMGSIVETDIPARLDRLPWGRFHTLVILALGITWVLDGLEVTLAGTLIGALMESPTLHFSAADIGYATSAYLAGAVIGAVGFGWLTDRLGRKKLFFITLATYLIATTATGLSWDIWSFCLFRFITGAGIGGEYTAVNSTIQELIPARARGWVNLAINGTFWLGAASGSLAAVVLLNKDVIDPQTGWRVAFFIGGGIGLVILLLRTWIPESPRWLLTHGRVQEAEAVVADIEERLKQAGVDVPAPPAHLPKLKIRTRSHTPFSAVFKAMLHDYRTQTLVGLSLMIAQAFFYNGVYFTYGIILLKDFGVPSDHVGWYLLPFAAGNFLGPLLLGRLFDTVGRRPMLAFTYGISGALLAVVGWLFQQGTLGPVGQTAAWMVVFFFASAAASSAYLTVSETFPLEVRALAIAVFYAVGTGVGGILGPSLFGALIDTGSRTNVFYGYLLGVLLLAVAAVVGGIWGVAAEGKSLEEIAKPLASAD